MSRGPRGLPWVYVMSNGHLRRLSTATLLVLTLSACAQPAFQQEADVQSCDVAGAVMSFAGLSDAGNSSDIFGLDSDDEVIALTDDGMSSDPVFHPDGATILFARADSGSGSAGGPPPATGLWTMASDGSNPQLLARAQTVRQPSYSADATMIAFSGVVGTAEDAIKGERIYTAAADGSEMRRLTNEADIELDFASESEPSWNPDGSQVAYRVTGSPDGVEAVTQIWIVDVGSRRSRSVHNGTGGLRGLSWSPDGQHLLFSDVSDNAATVYELDLADARTSVRVRDAFDATYLSTDGTQVAFARQSTLETEHATEIQVISVGQQQPRSVATADVAIASRLSVPLCALRQG